MTTTSRSGRCRNGLLIGSLLATLVTGLTGCSDGGALGTTAGAATSGGASDGASSTPAPGSGSPSGSPSATAPADGKEVSSDVFTAHVPARWHLRSMISAAIVGFAPDGGAAAFNVVPAFGASVSDRRLISEADRDYGWSRKPRVEQPVFVDGQRMVHLSGPIGGGKRADYYVGIHADYEVSLDLETRRSAADQAAIADAILASWHWK
ncbi:hypothetical protein [Nocardioides panaciterrulae]|uniref:Lipoprotein LpqN n=1 Tax=Nocardioides panaciterrulae TaxID=661492 RepID=A0A7Y9JBV3_9ACTN|nr:hypothetical protein [Nocardioides panaciterrulae]NYD43207.1 hypothetical protein [Nocardioides panaciterrulae]